MLLRRLQGVLTESGQRENRLDDMNEEVIHRRLQTYYDETFKTLSFFPSELIYDVDAGRRAIDEQAEQPLAARGQAAECLT